MLIGLLFVLYIISIEGYLGVERVNGVYSITLSHDCSTLATCFVKYKNSITIKCPFQPIEWIYKTKPNWKYNYQETISNSSYFTIHEVNYTNDGCICCRSMKDLKLACTHVKVEGPPIRNSTKWQWSIATYCGKPSEIWCPYTGYPAFNYTWIHWKKSKITEFPEVLKSQIHDPSLKLNAFSSGIGGDYLCLAQNKYGTIGSDLDHELKFAIQYPEDCQGYKQYLGANLSPEYTGTIGGNITMTCTLQFNFCSRPNKCADNVVWDNSVFPQNRTINESSYNCSICTGWQSITIINLQMSDFDKNYTCIIKTNKGAILVYNTTLKIASLNTQSFNVVPGLVPTTIILIILTLTTLIAVFIGVHYKRKITMFFYYRLAKEPPYEKGLQYDAFVSFSSRDIDFVNEKIYNVINKAGYEVIWYPDHFQAGDIILTKARDSIWKSRKTILCLSENFLQSDYCAAEKEFCFEKAMETFKNFLIVIHLDNCEIPADLKKLKIIEMNEDTGNQREYSKAVSNLKYLLNAPIDSVN